MTLTTADLESLAKVYGTTAAQLQAAPEDAQMVATLTRAHAILEGMTPEDLEHWLAVGERMKAASK